MHSKFIHYLRRERRKSGLTQRELAQLLTFRHRAQISRVERGHRNPSLATAIATCLIFGQSLEQLFPGLRAAVHERVTENAYRLYLQLEKDKTASGVKKRELLRAITRRQVPLCP